MGLGPLLVPAVGGYLLLTRLYWTRFHASRASGYHLFFQVLVAGSGLLALAYVLASVLEGSCPQVALVWTTWVPFDYSGTFAISAVLGLALPPILNLCYDKERASRNAAARYGNLMELLIADSMKRRAILEFSMRSGKSYIGYATKNEIIAGGEIDVELLPIWSGYRDEKTHKLTITTNYAPVMNESIKQDPVSGSGARLYNDFRIAFPMREVVSVRFFSPEIYKRFQAVKAPTS